MLPARFVLVGLLALAGCRDGSQPAAPLEPTRANVVRAAREVMDAARYCALVTVDAEGRPRARTVAPLPKLEGEHPLEVWIATRPATRKVTELRAEPRVVLYYFDAVRLEYTTITGTARLVDAQGELERRREFLSEELYPNWPEDCLLIAVQPERVEVQGRNLAPDPDTWRPAGIDFTPAAPIHPEPGHPEPSHSEPADPEPAHSKPAPSKQGRD